MKYRKKPIVIEAFKWTGEENQTEDPEWIIEAIKRPFGEVGSVEFLNDGTPAVTLEIFTLEGVHIARRGDYIIQGIQGELYPCKPDIFEATYEALETPTPGSRE